MFGVGEGLKLPRLILGAGPTPRPQLAGDAGEELALCGEGLRGQSRVLARFTKRREIHMRGDVLPAGVR